MQARRLVGAREMAALMAKSYGGIVCGYEDYALLPI